jgi:hypothetical protein
MPTISKSQAIKSGKPTQGLQTILMPKDRFSKESSKLWLKSHGYRYGNMRQTTNFFRFMQTSPIEGVRYVTETLPNGVELIFMRR